MTGQCGQLMRTSQPDPNPGTAPCFQRQETVAISPAALVTRAEDRAPAVQPGIFTLVGKCCCWSNRNGLHSCLIQDGGKAARMEKQPPPPHLPTPARFSAQRPEGAWAMKGRSGHSAKASLNARAKYRDVLPATSMSHGSPRCDTHKPGRRGSVAST